jgi:hypothetical protein
MQPPVLLISPITHGNYFRVGVQPNVPAEPEKALGVAYDLARKTVKSSLTSEELAKEKSEATKDPEAACGSGLKVFVIVDANRKTLRAIRTSISATMW